MAIDIFSFIPVIIGVVVGFLVSSRKRSKSGEPEHDERTEKVAGKAARSTIVVLMISFAVILWGDIFNLFKLETRETIAILFPVLLLSMLGFVTYYTSKDL
ncbi:putative membrane protein [Methanohalophilus levihalophilus]|uniref:DUF2178 domain-containing protein n=1 Tax=Methanohalophilus levihalophilus TaxID=1431282 RepID=UPI001AE2312E|nr:DUF2178 domain-containing protein [Methanohalophilus levihalophilus]MBP2029902.1 putative membrane protein [Methanohalophilus levihalophilus]